MPITLAKIAENFSRAAEQYDALAVQQNQWMQQGMKWAFTLFPATGNILDIGCGTGLFAAIASPPRTQWHITGVDIAPGMLSIAATRCAEVVEAGFEQLPFENASFDGVFSSLAIQWVEDKAQAFAEIARVLKPDGALVLVSLGDQNLCELRRLTDRYGISTLPMNSIDHYAFFANAAGLEVELMKSQPVKQRYRDARDLLDSMRAIGAGSAEGDPKKQQEIRAQISNVIREYDATYRSGDGVVATWEPICLTARKR